MKKTKLVIFLCLILAFISIIPDHVFATENDLFDNISDVFVTKNVNQQREKVILGGIPVGISLNNDCVEIVGFSQIITDSGAKSPASEAGLQIGDKITHINGKKVNKTEHIANSVAQCEKLQLSFLRNEKENNIEVKPQTDILTGKKKLGVWLKDQSFGVGTLTFVKDDFTFASLGHPITSKSGEILSISGGKIHDCTIVGANKGLIGKAGELKGTFNNKQYIGQIFLNNSFGVYGKFDKQPKSLDTSKIIEIADENEVNPGKAQIYSTIDGCNPKMYDIEIVKVKNPSVNEQKGLVIKITDKELLQKTGGIVQGMSGSPIIQNGKLIGAVTHVFINDPTRGYGVSINNMLDAVS